MKHSTATAFVSAEHRNVAREESAGPCPNDGCGGTLAVRHERQFGKVYTACERCERRVNDVLQLREKLQRATAEIAQLRAPKPVVIDHEAVDRRNAEIERRYLGGESSGALAQSYGINPQRVLKILAKRGVPRRSGQPRVYHVRVCAAPACAASFMPTGPRALFCPGCRS